MFFTERYLYTINFSFSAFASGAASSSSLSEGGDIAITLHSDIINGRGAMSTIRKEYGSILSSKPGDDRRHSFREIVEDELQLITDEVHTLTHASLRLNNQAITDPDRLHRDPAAGTATIPSEVANMSE